MGIPRPQKIAMEKFNQYTNTPQKVYSHWPPLANNPSLKSSSKTYPPPNHHIYFVHYSKQQTSLTSWTPPITSDSIYSAKAFLSLPPGKNINLDGIIFKVHISLDILGISMGATEREVKI